MCRIGDLEISEWSEFVRAHIKQTGEELLFENFSEFMDQRLNAGRSKRQKEATILDLFSRRIFDDEKWVLYLQFNRKYRPACIVPDHMAVILPHCCRKYGAIPKVQLPGQDCDGKKVCCPHCGVWTTYDYLKTMTMEDINNEQKKESDH